MSRKRRRAQPASAGSRALKIVLICGVAFLVLLFAGLLAVKSGIERYRNSEAFRDRVAGQVAGLLKSSVTLGSLRWDGATALGDGFRARGYADAALGHLDMDGLRATLGGVKDGAWQIQEARVNRLAIEFSQDRLPGDYASIAPTGSAAGSGVPPWLKRFIPDRFHIDTVEADAATLRVLDAAKAETFALRSVKAQFQPLADGGWEIAGQGGRLFFAARPEMGIDRFRVRWQGSQIFLNQAEIELLPGKARVSATGEIALGDAPGLDLELDVANLDIDEFLADPWRERLNGTIRGLVTVSGSPRDPAAMRQQGTLHLDDGLVKDVALLKAVTKYTNDKRFERLTLNEVTAEFTRQGERIEITRLAVQSDGLIRLEGTLTITGQALDGRLKLGVTPGTLRNIPGAERKVFVDARDGFLWTDLRLTGTLEQPKEDLTSRLIVGAGEALVEEAPQKVIDTAKEVIKDPAATPGTVIETGRKLFDGFNGLLPFLK